MTFHDFTLPHPAVVAHIISHLRVPRKTQAVISEGKAKQLKLRSCEVFYNRSRHALQ